MAREVQIQLIPDEEETYTDDSLFNIASFGIDLSFREIISMYEDGDLEKPELQRKYVWTKNEASRFIDSILLGLPIPSIFLAKTRDEKRLIVDGYQRIMTVFDYVTGIFSGDGKVFKLSDTKNINSRWKGKAFIELSTEEQRRIKTSSIHAIVFEQKKPSNDTAMYQIFERINTSGRILKPQEIRNCVYHGSFNNLLFELNKDDIWRSILGSKNEDSRMADVELILRYFAFCHFRTQEEIKQNRINLQKYFNDYMGRNCTLSIEKQDKYRQQFQNVIVFLYRLIGEKVFRSLSKKGDKVTTASKINPVIFDAICAATLNFLEANGFNYQVDKNRFFEDYNRLLTDDSFTNSIKVRTTDVDSIKSRISTASMALYGIEYEW